MGNKEYEEEILYDPVCDGESATKSIGATVDLPGGPTSVVVGLYTSSSTSGTDLKLVRTTSKIAR